MTEQAKQEKDQSRDVQAYIDKRNADFERHGIGIENFNAYCVGYADGFEGRESFAADNQWTRIETVDDLPKEISRQYLWHYRMSGGASIEHFLDGHEKEYVEFYDGWMPIPTYQEQGEPSS